MLVSLQKIKCIVSPEDGLLQERLERYIHIKGGVVQETLDSVKIKLEKDFCLDKKPDFFKNKDNEQSSSPIVRTTRTVGNSGFSVVDELLVNRSSLDRDTRIQQIITDFELEQPENTQSQYQSQLISPFTDPNTVEDLPLKLIINNRQGKINFLEGDRVEIIRVDGVKIEFDASGKLIIIIGDENHIHFNGNGIRARVTGNTNKIDVKSNDCIVFVEGDTNKINVTSVNNIVILGRDAIRSRLYAHFPRNDFFISGDENKVVLKELRNFAFVAATGFKNRVYSEMGLCAMRINGSNSKIQTSGNNTSIIFGATSKENRAHIESNDNKISVSGLRNDVNIRFVARRNNILVTKVSFEAMLCIVGWNTTITDNGWNTDIVIQEGRGTVVN